MYESTSGQHMNRDKTFPFFSNNTTSLTQWYIMQLIGLNTSTNMETYLGLPYVLGRSKAKAFHGIIDKVNGKLLIWKTRFLSTTGKEILIKAVVQALPTNCMSLFKLPKCLFQQLNSLISTFWWETQDSETHMHWKSCEAMCMRKPSGGLGLRDLEAFNSALLAKQAWKLLKSPTSIATQIYGDKYLPTSVLSAKLGPRPSYVWRSI